MNQTLVDEIVANVLARLQPTSARTVNQAVPVESTHVAAATLSPQIVRASESTAHPPQADSTGHGPNDKRNLPASDRSQVTQDSKPSSIELFVPIITADLLEKSVRPGQKLWIGRTSILTPSARDWLHSKQSSWSRIEKHGGTASTSMGIRSRWQIILQTVTPTVRALHDSLRRLSEAWTVEVVGQPREAVALATNQISTAECDGVVIFTEQAELIACQANRNDRVRAAVIQNAKQWDQVVRTLGANVVCVCPIGRTFMELRSLLRDVAGTRPMTPAGW